MTKDDIDQQILWFDALLDSILDGDTESAIEAINAAIKLLRRMRADAK